MLPHALPHTWKSWRTQSSIAKAIQARKAMMAAGAATLMTLSKVMRPPFRSSRQPVDQREEAADEHAEKRVHVPLAQRGETEQGAGYDSERQGHQRRGTRGSSVVELHPYLRPRYGTLLGCVSRVVCIDQLLKLGDLLAQRGDLLLGRRANGRVRLRPCPKEGLAGDELRADAVLVRLQVDVLQ